MRSMPNDATESTKMLIVFSLVVACTAQLCPAQNQEQKNRKWVKERLLELRDLAQDDKQTLDKVIERVIDIAKQAASKDAEDVLHNALSIAVERTNLPLSGSIIMVAQSDRTIRLSLGPFAERLYERSKGDIRVIELLGEIAREPENGNSGYYQLLAVESIKKLTADKDVLRRVLLPVAVLTTPLRASYPSAEIVAPLVTQEDLDSMRNLAITSLKNLRFHPVVEILSYQGDVALLPHLERARDGLTTKSRSIRFAYIKAIWKIQTQNPPGKLLESIRTEHPVRDRGWMIERAVALDVDRDQIRAAVLEYARRQMNPSDPAWMVQRPRIVASAQKLDILTPVDIETIPPANPRPVPSGKPKT